MKSKQFLIFILIIVFTFILFSETATAKISDILNDPNLQVLMPAQELADLSGYNGSRIYLLLGQNTSEIRPTGGFISYLGIISITNGQPKTLWINYSQVFENYYKDVDPLTDSSLKTGYLNKPNNYWFPFYGEPYNSTRYPYKTDVVGHPWYNRGVPTPLENTWPWVDNLFVRDANWMPDFAIDANQDKTGDNPYHSLIHLFADEAKIYNKMIDKGYINGKAKVPYVNTIDFDGVIAFNDNAGAYILDAIGPITLDTPGEIYDGAILNSDNFILENFYWRKEVSINRDNYPDWYKEHNIPYMEGVTDAVLTKMNSADDTTQSALVNKILEMLYEKHLLVYSKNSQNQLALEQLNWAGRFNKTATTDFLHFTDANIGGMKSDLYTDREVTHDVTINPDVSFNDNLEITYTNKGVFGYFDPIESIISDPNRYRFLENKYYRGWQRIYFPKTATGFKQGNTAKTPKVELSRNSFGSWVTADPGESVTTSYNYNVPNILKKTSKGYKYSILVQKQMGSTNYPFTLNFSAPPWTITDAKVSSNFWSSKYPSPIININNDSATVNTDLWLDRTIDIYMDPPPAKSYNPNITKNYVSWTTPFIIQNKGDKSAFVFVSFQKKDGTEAHSVGNQVAKGASWGINPASYSNLGTSFQGSVIIYSDQPTVSIINEHSSKSSMAYEGVDPNNIDNKIYLPNITRSYSGWTTPFVIQNLGTSEATINVEYYRKGQSNPTYEETLTALSAGSSVGINPSKKTNLGVFQGSVVIKGTQNITAIVNEHYTDNKQTMSYNGFSENAGAQEVYLPNITRDYYGWTTPFAVQNIGDSPTDVTIKFYKKGTKDSIYTHSVKNLGAKTSFTLNPSSLPLGSFQGSVVISSTSQNIVSVVNEHSKNDSMSYTGVSASTSSVTTNYLPNITRSYYGWTTPFVVQNLDTISTAEVKVTFFNQSGSSVKTITGLTIPSGASLGFNPGSYKDLGSSFKGSVIVESMNGKEITSIVNEHHSSGQAMAYNGF